ncbi:isopentenyl-diphosphate Delta-isomerase [bacterium]|nr:isopentenyl-diphosphate Delta-isomerase [bacterium]
MKNKKDKELKIVVGTGLDLSVVILVDNDDNPVGVEEKLAAHLNGGKLHRAFSVFLYDPDGNMLLQRRSAEKYHSPGLWSNACCGHPQPGEETAAAAARRVTEELGITVDIKEITTARYDLDVGQGLFEREFNHTFKGVFTSENIPFNTSEVSEIMWVSCEELRSLLSERPQELTIWFRALLMGSQFKG